MDDGENTKKDADSRIEESFLHEINVDAVLKETGMNLDELCKLINVDNQSVGRWNKPKSKAGNRPKYNAIVRLLRAGATTKTLFGVDAATHQPAVPSEIARDSEFQEGLQAAMDAKIEAKVDAKVKAVVADMLREYGLPPRNGSV